MPVSELEKIVSLNVGDKISERSVSRDDLGPQAALIDLRQLQRKPDQILGGDLRANPGPVIPASHVRPNRRKDVAPMERRGQLAANHPIGICNLADGFNPIARSE